MKLRVLDLFSGIGAYSLGLQRAGMETVAFCENDEWCRKLLRQNYPKTPIFGDIETQSFEGLNADVIIGGFPCQDISRAGKRAGIAGARSGLFWEMVRAIRVVRPLHVIVENVSALLDRTGGMGVVLGALAESRYDTEWDCISLDEIGAPHGRPRVWLVATDSGPHNLAGRRERIAQEGCKATADADSANVGKGSSISISRRERLSGGCAENITDTNSQWKLQSPWVFGHVRRRIYNGDLGTFWTCNWETKFKALHRMDVRTPTRLDRARDSKAIGHLGNCNPPIIPQAIGEAIIAQDQET